MADNFGLKIGVEGEKEFKKALADINQSFKVLGSEMKLVSSQFDKNDKSVQALSARNSVLNKEIEAQKQKIDTLRSALQNASDSFGETDRRTQSWQIQLNNAEDSGQDAVNDLRYRRHDCRNNLRQSCDKRGQKLNPGEMILTVHRWFANKSCPGNWMYARMGDLAEKVTAALGGNADSATNTQTTQTSVLYRVRKTWADSKSQKGAFKILENARKCADANPGYSVFDVNGVNIYTTNTISDTTAAVPFLVKVSISDLNVRKGPGTDYDRTQFIPVGVYTIVEVKSGKGSTAGWGRLKSGAGWISLDFCTRI